MDADRSKKESAKSRRILVSNLSEKVNVEEMKKELFYSQNFKVSYLKLDGNSAEVTLSNPSEAQRAAQLINGQLFKGKRISVVLAPFSSSGSTGGLVVVGNLPFDYTEDQFRKLMSPHGDIKKLFLVRNRTTGQSKGYGFVEYVKKDSATKAKAHFTSTNAKFVNDRIIRVDIATPNLLIGKEQHSRTLFIDHLPKNFDDDEYLKDLFSKTGMVTFCKVATNSETGSPRGFAFVDFETVEEAEQSQEYHDGTLIGDNNIRVTFCTPGKTGQDILGKFEYQMSNNRDLPPGPRALNPPFLPIGPAGMSGPRGPRMPISLGNSLTMLPMERRPRPVAPLMGRGLRPRPFVPGIPGAPGRPVPPHVPRLVGPEAVSLRPRFVVRPSLVEPQGPRLRVPLTRPPNVRLTRPRGQSDYAVRKNGPKTTTYVKPRVSSATTAKAREPVKSTKPTKEEKPDPSSEEKATKEDSSGTVSLSELQKLGASALAAAMQQSPSESGGVKVLQPVVFMDAEQFQQFQQFQQLMQKQKEAGGLTAVSLEELAKAQQVKEQNEESCAVEPALEESPAQPKQLLPQPKQSPAQSKQSEAPQKQSPAQQRPAKANQLQEQQVTKGITPRRVAQPQQREQQRSKETSPRHPAQQQQPPPSKEPSARRPVQQQRSQQQQLPQQQEQRKIKAVGAYDHERKGNHASYYNSNKMDKNSVASDVPPLQPPPQLPIEPHILQKLFTGSNKRPLDMTSSSNAETKTKPDYQEVRRSPGGEQSRYSRMHQGNPESPYSGSYKSPGQQTSTVRESPRGIPGVRQQYQSTEGKDRINVPKRSPGNNREAIPHEQAYSRSRYPYAETSQRERSSGDPGLGQSPSLRHGRENKEGQEPRTRSEMQVRERDTRSTYDTLPRNTILPARDLRVISDAVAARDLRSLRDMIPSRDPAPSRDTLPPRDSPLPRERSARDMSPYTSLASRELRQRDSMPPRDTSRDPYPSRTTFTPRDARSALDPPSAAYDRGMTNALGERDAGRLRSERESLSPRYKASEVSPRMSREALDRARYERVAATRYDQREDYPRYEKEPLDSRYPRGLPSRESSLGSGRGLPPHYPMEGPVSKRPRY